MDDHDREIKPAEGCTRMDCYDIVIQTKKDIEGVKKDLSLLISKMCGSPLTDGDTGVIATVDKNAEFRIKHEAFEKDIEENKKFRIAFTNAFGIVVKSAIGVLVTGFAGAVLWIIKGMGAG